jgi:thiamine-phosphate pyrophosphorylase
VKRTLRVWPWRICVVTNPHPGRGRTPAEIAEQAIAGGADAIQFRDKEASGRAFLEAARPVREICRQAGVAFIVNDRIDVALAIDADGAHVGQDDMPAAEARRLLGPERVLGVSAATVVEAAAAAADGADYLGVGPVFEARGTKPDAGRPIGVEGVAAIAAAIKLPVLAIGGIHVGNAAGVFRAGAAGIAVISAVVGAPNVAEAVRGLRIASSLISKR